MPAPPARSRSASVPCGHSSTSSFPDRNSCSKILFSPTYELTIRLTWPCARRTPRPCSVVPQLFDTIVRSRTPRRASSRMQFSGLPDSPNPPHRRTAPSPTSCSASRALGKTLFIGCMLTASRMAIITLTTDFGTRDGYVGAVKGVLARLAPADTIVVDLAHDIPRGDIAHAAWVVASSTQEFPYGTIHLVVVDPGVGGSRREVIAWSSSQWYVGPDNGVLDYVADASYDAWAIE